MTFKTTNNNYLIPDRGYYRFINLSGAHLRWVDDEEVSYLERVLEAVEEAPKPIDMPDVPSIERYWQFIERAENPELSNNGGSYDNLTRIEKWSGWGMGDGYRLVTNHLYNSDFEDQGWHSESLADPDEFIVNFKPSRC